MIQVSDLSKHFDDLVALDRVNFQVQPGEVVGYLGPNGAGKSTTMKILTGVSKPTSGTAVVAGFDVTTDPIEVKKRIGYVPENANLYSTLSVEEYLSLVGALHKIDPPQVAERSKAILTSFEIADAFSKRIDTLSKGMKQKVLLTSAILHDPDVLLLDEPLSGLDANAVQTVKETIRNLANEGKTVVYCSHMLDIVEKICDRVVILNQGKIIKEGNPQELMHHAHRDSLANVFRSLTSKENHGEIANQIVLAMKKTGRDSEAQNDKQPNE